MSIGSEHARIVRKAAHELKLLAERKGSAVLGANAQKEYDMLLEAANLLDPPNPDHSSVLEAMKDQLLLVLVGRLGGKAVVPLHEIDNYPRGKNLLFSFHAASETFELEVQEKEKS